MALFTNPVLRRFAHLFVFGILIGVSVGRAEAHGAYHDLVRDLEDKLAQSPGTHDYRFQLASAHVEHGEWEAALHEIEHLSRVAPGEFETGFLSGKALAAAGLLVESHRELCAYLAIHPGDQATLVERARVLLRLGQTDAGVADYLSAISTPAKAEIYVEASEAFLRHGRREEALRCAEEGERKSDGDPAVLICAMHCARELGRVDAVVERLDRLIGVWPRPEIWMRQKAEYLAEAGRAEQSQDAWRKLHGHLMSLPNLERATPFLADSLEVSRRALGLAKAAPVVAPPAAGTP